jgi:hypothetical protein
VLVVSSLELLMAATVQFLLIHLWEVQYLLFQQQVVVTVQLVLLLL